MGRQLSVLGVRGGISIHFFVVYMVVGIFKLGGVCFGRGEYGCSIGRLLLF